MTSLLKSFKLSSWLTLTFEVSVLVTILQLYRTMVMKLFQFML